MMREEIRIRGQDTLVPAAIVFDRKTVVTGSVLRIAQVKDEDLVPGGAVQDPAAFLEELRRSSLKADLFTFAERPPIEGTRHSYRHENENWAMLPLTTFDEWWDSMLPQESRKNARRAEKRGVVVRRTNLDDELVGGIKDIYDESPVRQGRPFWHYRKDLDSVKRINETYRETSDFIGAYFEGRLIGFIKVVYVDHFAMIMQILAMSSHQDKRPMNALMKGLVQRCTDNAGVKYLVYGQYTYGKRADSSLAEFKRRNGFRQFDYPRYYVPLTARGKLAMIGGVHLGVQNVIPPALADRARKVRSWFYGVRAGRKSRATMRVDAGDG